MPDNGKVRDMGMTNMLDTYSGAGLVRHVRRKMVGHVEAWEADRDQCPSNPAKAYHQGGVEALRELYFNLFDSHMDSDDIPHCYTDAEVDRLCEVEQELEETVEAYDIVEKHRGEACALLAECCTLILRLKVDAATREDYTAASALYAKVVCELPRLSGGEVEERP